MTTEHIVRMHARIEALTEAEAVVRPTHSIITDPANQALHEAADRIAALRAATPEPHVSGREDER